MTNMTTNAKVVDAFVKNTTRAEELLKAILVHVEDHFEAAPDDVTWGHVGTAGKACEDLEELARFLRVKV